MGFISDWLDRRDAKRETDANKKVAKYKADKFIQQVIAHYSQYGEVIELQDGEKLLGKHYSYRHIDDQGLGYRLVEPSVRYEEVYAVSHSDTDYYVSGYSGTVSSSGSVDLSPDYSSVTVNWQTIERGDSSYTESHYIKPIERGKKDTVLQLEQKFFANDGDLYSRLKNSYSFLSSTDLNSILYRLREKRKKIAQSFLVLMALVCIFCDLAPIIGLQTEDFLKIADVIFIILIIAFAYQFHSYGKLKKFDHEGHTFDIDFCYDINDIYTREFQGFFVFLFIAIAFFTNIYGIFFNDVEVMSYGKIIIQCLIYLLQVILFIVLIKYLNGFKKESRDIYNRLLNLINNETKMKELEELAAEINSYTKTEAYKNWGKDSVVEDNGGDHSPSYYFIH